MIKKKATRSIQEKENHEFLEEMVDFVQIFIDARKQKNMTQAQLAKKIGSTQASIARFESSKSNPTFVFLIKISEELDLMINVNKL